MKEEWCVLCNRERERRERREIIDKVNWSRFGKINEGRVVCFV